jgi:hypothetical protein
VLMRTRWLLALAIAGCSDGGTEEAPPLDGVDGQSGACTAFEGHTFESLEEHECGLGPGGASMCLWHLSFAALDTQHSNFAWQHSDVGETGTARCTGRQILTDGISRVYSGSYDPDARHLTWDGLQYAIKPS